jgi:hypothetical protein
VGGVQRQLDVFGGGARHFAEGAAGDRADVLEVLALDRRHEFAADEVVVALLEGIAYAEFADVCQVHVVSVGYG